MMGVIARFKQGHLTVGNGVVKYRSLHGDFSFVCIQQGGKLLEYLGNVDLTTLSVYYLLCGAEGFTFSDIKDALGTSATRLQEAVNIY